MGSASRLVLDERNTPSNVERALSILVDYVRAQRKQTKLPPASKVADAFNFVFHSRLEHPKRFSRNEIFLAAEAFKHLLQEQGTLSNEDLKTALAALAVGTGKDRFRSDSKALAYMIFEELRLKATQASEASVLDQDTAGGEMMDTYIAALSSTGGAREARDLLCRSTEEEKRSPARWITVIKGLATEGLDKEVWMTLGETRKSTGLLDSTSHEELTTFFASEDKVGATKRLYETEIKDGNLPTLKCRLAVANFCIRNDQIGWGTDIFEGLLREDDTSQTLDALLLWFAVQGKGTDEMESFLRQQDDGMAGRALKMSNINRLLRYAYLRDDLVAVQDYLGWAKKRNLQPNPETYLLQLEHQLKINDLPAAVSTYDVLSAKDPITDRSDVHLLNIFLVKLCFSAEPDYELIMRVVDSLLDRGADLDAETVSALCYIFLHRDEYEEAMGLLRHRVDSYPTGDRARISAVFRSFILDIDVNEQRAFNAYELFRHAFPETPVPMRLSLMHSFFDRKRPDLACLVFGHMRQREDAEGRPTSEAYAQCFEGIAKCNDVEGLQTVYNMLKLDLEVEISTRIHNSLMVAYTACEMPFTAVIDHFWKIMNSREGPTLNSFAFALRACEKWIPQGAQEARRIMAMMQAWGLEITKDIYLCYIGALAGQSEFENTIELIEEMERDIGEKPDAITYVGFLPSP